MGYREDIRHEVALRGIQYLVHFTQFWNLSSIVTHGLLSRADLLARGLGAYVSAGHRLDEMNGAISVSISAINLDMFRAKQATCGRTEWVVLLLHPSVLWTHNCRFLWTNAATREVKRHTGRLDGHWGFAKMFEDKNSEGASYRAEIGIFDCLTTHPDAEVQVFNPIAPETILHAWVESRDLAEAVQAELNRLPSTERDVQVQEFKPRFWNDHSAWG